MKKVLVAIGSVVLLTCCIFTESGGGTCDGSIHSTTETTVDKYGVELLPSDNMYIKPDAITGIYEEVQACMGMVAPGPKVQFISFSERGLGGSWAFYIFVYQWVMVNTDEDEILQRSCETDKEALKHEFVHHILEVNGFPRGDNEFHYTKMFEKCGVGPQLMN